MITCLLRISVLLIRFLFARTAESHLARLDRVQLQAQRLFSEIPLPILESCRVAVAAVGLTCRLLSGSVSSPLLSLTPVLMSSTGSLLRRSARLIIRTSCLTSVLIILWKCLRGLTGEGFLTSGTVSNQICWLLLDLPAADHYNVYVLFIYDIDYNVY